jgi:nucleoside phosphorylase
MGEAAAARAAPLILEHYEPEVFISLGFGGALTPELPPGALVLGETCWRYEPDAGTLQELAPYLSPVWLKDFFNRIQAAGLPAFRGNVITTPVIIDKLSQGSPLLNLNHPVLDLETAAVAACVRDSGLPFLALRVVTDTCGEEIPDFIRQAAQAGNQPTAGTALAWLTNDPRRLAALMRLWRRSRLAADHLDQALEVVLEMV